ncbi:hypothetical protein TWF594_005394 [Orbilia oligospora]|nr:hypothetical protein TWF594_005394 [Orbilia oligospora]
MEPLGEGPELPVCGFLLVYVVGLQGQKCYPAAACRYFFLRFLSPFPAGDNCTDGDDVKEEEDNEESDDDGDADDSDNDDHNQDNNYEKNNDYDGDDDGDEDDAEEEEGDNDDGNGGSGSGEDHGDINEKSALNRATLIRPFHRDRQTA